MPYKPVRRATASNNLTDRVTSMLRDDIINGKYEPGRKLPPSKEMSEVFGVSITVVREALSRLKSDGLIASHQGKGVFVENDTKARPFRLATSAGTQPSLRHIFELRMAVEMQAAVLAAERRRPSDLKAMSGCLKLMEPTTNTFKRALESDISFHLAIAVCIQKLILQDVFGFSERRGAAATIR